jgi:hypothetical protein
MTAINFDEPSEGHTNSLIKPALSIVNTRGVGIRVTNSSGNQSALVGISIPPPTGGITGKPAGVAGISKSGWIGVRGETNSNRHEDEVGAVVGVSTDLARGGWFQSKSGEGLRAVTGSEVQAAIVGVSTGGDGVRGITSSDTNAAIVGMSNGLGPAGKFHGNIEVTGDIRLLNADCAEDFDIADSECVEAGTVMVLNEFGSLQPSYQEYDKKVAGIVSGACGYTPAIVLDRQHSRSQNQSNNVRLPVALIGKAYCKVDARDCSIEIGDLLTTSSMKGYAMKAEDPIKAFGAVIGKALGSIKKGLGMIPVLVTLQ